MSDMPERVWVTHADAQPGPREAYLGVGSWPGERTEYIRADLVPDAEAAMRAGYEMAAKEAREIGVHLRRFDLVLNDMKEGK